MNDYTEAELQESLKFMHESWRQNDAFWAAHRPGRSLRPLNAKARRHFIAGLLALLPESGGWSRQEREDWLALCRYLVDWLVVVSDAPERVASVQPTDTEAASSE